MLSRTLTVATCLGLAFAQTGPAPVATNNQQGEWYIADLTASHGPGNVTGSIGIAGDIEGKGVRVSYTFEGFDLNDSKEYCECLPYRLLLLILTSISIPHP